VTAHRTSVRRARPRSARALAVAGVLLVAAVSAGTARAVHAFDAAPALTIAPVGSVPNSFYKSVGDGFSTKVGLLADPVNHLLFEFQPNNNTCPYVLDSDTYAIRAHATGEACSAFAGVNQATTTSLGVAAVVDPVDHVVVATDNQRDSGATLSAVGLGEMHVMAESDLHTLHTWALPTSVDPSASPQSQIAGVSWYAPLDEMLVLTGNFGNGGVLPGVSVSAVAMGPSLKAGRPVVLWTVAVTQCQAAFIPNFASAAAYHASSESDLYVPCVLLLPNAAQEVSQSNERDGVVKIPLAHSGCTAPATECPNLSAAQVAVAPGVSSDTVFDPGADRVFMISGAGGFIPSSAVLSVMVYSGHLDEFLGAAVVGGTNDVSDTGAAFDAATGRFYVVNTRGLSIVDSRRTPVTPGSIFGAYAEVVSPPAVFPVLPPDTAHPYTRLIVNTDRVAPNGAGYMPAFTVFGDTLPVSVDPPADVVDSHTIRGPIPQGAQVQRTVGGSARGYGWHNDLVGGPDDLANAGDDLNEATENFAGAAVNLPLGKGNRDLLGGGVERLNVRTDGVDGAASALAAADDSTAYNVQQCTDAQQVVNCVQPPAAPPAGVPGATSQPTGQLMPFPSATCSQPGSAADRGSTVDGAYYTTWRQDAGNAQQWDAQQNQVPGTDQTQAHATTSCTGTASGTAWLRGARIGSSGGPTFSVASAATSSTVSPPSGDGVVTSTVSAVAEGIDVDLATGSSPSHISIASVSQTAVSTAGGKPGTARASDLVVISGVSVDGTPVCTTQCDPSQVAAALNQAFPTLLHVEAPQPDSSFMSGCTVRADGERDCLGSPGGYKASVEANLVEQLGDHDFNGMATNEATLVPALRLILYFANDGNPARSRDVLDLAGVASTSTLGYSALPGITPFTATAEVLAQAYQAAAGTPPTSTFVPGTPGGGVALAAAPQHRYSTGPLGVLERTFDGIAWLVRSPLGALQMIGYLAALGVPIVLARRRRGLSAP